MTDPVYISQCGTVVLYQGDCMDVLPQLTAASVDALIVDAPYCSGGLHRGDRTQSTVSKYQQSGQKVVSRPDFQGDARDQRSFRYWSDGWLRLCRRAVVPGGAAALFSDWRQVPITTDAVQGAGWVWRGLSVWNKGDGARPQIGRPRSQAEFVIFSTNGPQSKVLASAIGVLPGVWSFPVLQKDKFHLTGKPSALMTEVVKLCPAGGLVLDPFAGSGSTAIGCIRAGRKFVGCEIDPSNVEIAIQRIERELASVPRPHGQPVAGGHPTPTAA